MKKFHRMPYHLVEPSPWPMTFFLSALFITLGLINLFYFNNKMNLLLFSVMMMMMSMFQWWRDLIREATYMGKHTKNTQNGLRLGMLLFIISEVCFFFSFFWSYFHMSLHPSMELGCSWPPIGITIIDPFGVPFLNTTILLASGFTITRPHYSILMQMNKAILSMMMTIMLGIYFTILQLAECKEYSFTIDDSVYGSIFFTATGFHGANVIIGTLLLLINLIRIIKSHFSKTHHLEFKMAAWYWHFIDVIWICLYTCIYWWGSL